ncbi:MAG: hypothetical protein LCH52_01675 [Bacteroidetes bacterium]|nr:hypothetical protein [Bacteroidota bacterium]
MKHVSFLLLAVLVLPAYPQSVFHQVMKTELAFSALSVKSGIKTSFLAFLSDSCKMYDEDTLVDGKPLYEKRSGEEKNTLVWYPDHIIAPEDGEIAFSTGVYNLKRRSDSSVISSGRFYTVWKKEGTDYKAIFDGGNETDDKFQPFDEKNVRHIAVSQKEKSTPGFDGFYKDFINRLYGGKLDGKDISDGFVGIINGKSHKEAEGLLNALKEFRNVSKVKELKDFSSKSGNLAVKVGSFVSVKFARPVMFLAVFTLQKNEWKLDTISISL